MSFLIQQLLNGVMYGCTYSLIGIGFNLIFGVLNMINLAHGEVIMAGAFAGISLVLFLHAPLVVAFFGAMLAAGLIGMLVERTCL